MKNFLLAPKMFVVAMVMLGFAVCLSVGGVTWAYFVDSVTSTAEYSVVKLSSKVYESSLSGSSVTIGSEYTTSSTIASGSSKTLTIQNTSDLKTTNSQENKVLLRVSFSVVAGANNTTDYTCSLVDNSVYTNISGQANAGFTAIENGYYYYNAPMLKNQYAPFATFTNTGSSAIHVSLWVEVVQASLDVAQNYWNYKTGGNRNSNLLSTSKTIDNINITTANGLVVMVPNSGSWRQATTNDSLDANYTSGATSLTIPTLSGTSNCMRIYNNATTPIILALRMNVSLYQGNVSSPEWSVGGLFENLSLKFNFANDTADKWIDIRNNATAHTFNVGSTGQYVSFLYNEIVKPGESVYALTNTADITNAVSQSGFKFHIVCEVLGYDASESNYVDGYLSLTMSNAGIPNAGISTGDRVPLYYAYTTTDSTSNLYTTQLDANGRYNDRASYYSQYAKWYNTISSSLT